MAERLIKNQLISALLNVIANVSHPESQVSAAQNLIYLFERFEYVSVAMRASMGDTFIDLLIVNVN